MIPPFSDYLLGTALYLLMMLQYLVEPVAGVGDQRPQPEKTIVVRA